MGEGRARRGCGGAGGAEVPGLVLGCWCSLVGSMRSLRWEEQVPRMGAYVDDVCA